MDIRRPDLARLHRRRTFAVVAALVSVGLGIASLARLGPAELTVDRDDLWIGTVSRGEMIREVRAPGVLVPVTERWISASREGSVEEVLLAPGKEVTAETVILTLGNSELAQEVFDAEAELRAAEAEYRTLEARLDNALLDQQAQLAAVRSERAAAELQREADERLAEEGLIPELSLRFSRLRCEQLAAREAIEVKRLERLESSSPAELAARSSRLESRQALLELRREQLAGLQVRAGIDGILQEVAVEAGQRITAGTVLARVSRPEQLKAELRVAETQARDLHPGTPAEIDTRIAVVTGRVSRVDPAARQGTVTVEVLFDGPLPRGARPELSVDGTLTLERLDDVLFLERPAGRIAGERASLFRLTEDGEHAERTLVELGRTSTRTVEIVAGLSEGDRVVLSANDDWSGHDRIRLE